MEGVRQWHRGRNKCSNLLEKFKSYSNSRNFINAHELVYQPLEHDNQETKDDHSMLREISVSEVIQTLQKRKNRSASGEDNIILNSKKLI